VITGEVKFRLVFGTYSVFTKQTCLQVKAEFLLILPRKTCVKP